MEITLQRVDVIRPLVLHIRTTMTATTDRILATDTLKALVISCHRDLRRLLQVFLTELSDPLGTRRIAARNALEFIFPLQPSSSSALMMPTITGSHWLDRLLVEPPYSECLAGHLLRWIRKAILVETDLHVVSFYNRAISSSPDVQDVSVAESNFIYDTTLLQMLSTRPMTSSNTDLFDPHSWQRIVGAISRSLNLAARCIVDGESLQAIRSV